MNKTATSCLKTLSNNVRNLSANTAQVYTMPPRLPQLSRALVRQSATRSNSSQPPQAESSAAAALRASTPPSSPPTADPTPAISEESMRKGKGKGDPEPTPPLSRPPGILARPSGSRKSWTQRKDEMLDDERARVKRKALCVSLFPNLPSLITRVKEATQGYFHDYNQVRSTSLKHWIAPDRLIREDVGFACGSHGDLSSGRSVFSRHIRQDPRRRVDVHVKLARRERIARCYPQYAIIRGARPVICEPCPGGLGSG